MASSAELMQRVLDNCYSLPIHTRPGIWKLAANSMAGATELTVDTYANLPNLLGPTDVLEFADGEQFYIYNVADSQSPEVLTVESGFNGTTEASHSSGDLIWINPIFTRKKVLDALEATLRELKLQDLYIYKTGTLTLVAGQDLYELSETDALDSAGVVSIFYQESSDDRLVPIPFRPVDDLEGITGPAVELVSWGNNSAGDSLTYIYKAEIDSVADSDDEPALEEILVDGATAKVLASQEGARSVDPGRRTDRTVQPGQHLRNSTYFLGNYIRGVRLLRANLSKRQRNFPRHPRYARALRWRP